MTPLIRLMTTTRNARRDAALARVTGASRALDESSAAQARASAELDVARSDLRRLAHEPPPGASFAWRSALLAAGEAALSVRVRRLAESQAVVAQAAERLQAARVELAQCERALMRNDELAALERVERRLAQERAEHAVDEDLSISGRPARSEA